MTLRSPRGFPLVLSNGIPKEPTLTVELYAKWYCLYKVFPDGRVEQVRYPDDPECCPAAVSPYRDHVPNPRVVMLFAKRNMLPVDELAFELMVGRWEIEAEGNYSPEGFRS